MADDDAALTEGHKPVWPDPAPAAQRVLIKGSAPRCLAGVYVQLTGIRGQREGHGQILTIWSGNRLHEALLR